MVTEITPHELVAKLNSPTPPLLVDVREPSEYELTHIAGGQLRPLGAIAQWAAEFDKASEIVCYCRTGGRSLRAAQYLASLGFKNVINLKGGIHAWADQIDPSVPKY